MCTGTIFPLCNLYYYLGSLDLLLFCMWVAECGHAVMVTASAMLHCNMKLLKHLIFNARCIYFRVTYLLTSTSLTQNSCQHEIWQPSKDAA